MTCTQRPHLHERVQPARTTARWLRDIGLATALFVLMVAPPGAQTPEVKSAPAGVLKLTPRLSSVGASVHPQIDLLVGRSTVLTTDRPIRRVSLSTPDVADALVTSPHEVLIHGKSPGTISLLVWNDTGRISSHEVVVRRDLETLGEHLSQLFPGEAITVAANGSDIVIAGTVSNAYVVEKAAAVAAGYVENAENVVNLLRQQEGVASEQIMLRVRFAEVSRTAMQELGASFFTNILGHGDYVGRVTTQQFAAPDFDNDEGLVFSDFLNILAFNTSEDIGIVIKALKTRGLFQSLAEPNLITQNGTEATFLAGGEYPYPVAQGVSGAVTVMFKEFGVRLRFTPTIVGPDRIHLNAVTISGFRVPSLTSRKTDSEVELRDGQTFAIAGLIDNTVTETMSKIPGLGDIPILGLLFKSRAYQKNQTELVVMITPHIIRGDSPGVAPRLPNLVQPFLEPPDETLPPPPAPQYGADLSGGTPDVAATVLPDDAQAPSNERIPAVVPASAAAASGPATAIKPPLDPRAERKRLEVERKQAEQTRKAEEKVAREEAKRVAKHAAERARRAAEEAKRVAKAEQQRLDVERKEAEETHKADEKLAREEAKRAAAEAKRAAELAKRLAKAEQKRLDVERKQAEETRKADEKLAREEAKRAAAEAKRAAELAKRLAKAEQKRLEVERKQAEETRKADEKLAREEAKRAAAEAKRAAELAKRLAKAEQKRLEVERKQAEQTRKAEEKVAREEAKRAAELVKRVAKAEQKRLDAERKQAKKTAKEEEKLAMAQAMADAKRYEREWKQAEKERQTLAKERAKRQAELDRILAEFQQKLGSAQRAVDDIDREQQRLGVDGQPEPDSGRR